MAYVKRRSYPYKRTYIAKRKYFPKFKKNVQKPMYKRSGYRKKFTGRKPRRVYK